MMRLRNTALSCLSCEIRVRSCKTSVTDPHHLVKAPRENLYADEAPTLLYNKPKFLKDYILT
jgi:hypothetical protein